MTIHKARQQLKEKHPSNYTDKFVINDEYLLIFDTNKESV